MAENAVNHRHLGGPELSRKPLFLRLMLSHFHSVAPVPTRPGGITVGGMTYYAYYARITVLQ